MGLDASLKNSPLAPILILILKYGQFKELEKSDDQ